jgi:hypothetical protein
MNLRIAAAAGLLSVAGAIPLVLRWLGRDRV